MLPNEKTYRLRTLLVVATILMLSAQVSFAQEVPYLQWAYRIGTRLDDEGRQIKVDAAGNVYTIGIFRSTVDFDPSAATTFLSSSGNFDAFITKFSPTGNFIWARKFGGTSNDYAHDLAFDSNGDVLVIGEFDETVDFDPDPVDLFNLSAPGGGMFVVKLDDSGDFIWATAVENANGQSVIVDASNNIYATGYFMGSADFDPGSSSFPFTSNGGADIFVQKLDASGNFVSAIAMGGTSSDSGVRVLFSPLNEIYLTGYFSTTFDFDPGLGTTTLTSAGGSDIFLSKWDTNLNLNWAHRFGAANSDRPYSATVDGAGNIYLTGSFTGTVDFDPGAGTSNLVSAGNADVFMTKYNAAGSLLLAKQVGGTNLDVGAGIAVDASENIYLTGYFAGTVDFDPGIGIFDLLSNGSQDIFVSKLTAAGNFMWAVNSGAANADYGYSIALDNVGDIYTTGLFRNTVDFDFGAATLNLTSPQNITGSNNRDAFFQKISTTPSIFVYTQPAPVTICTGANTTLNVLGTGTFNITYQWQWFDGSSFIDLVDGANVSGATSTQLILTNVTAVTDGDYRCQISGDFVTSLFSNTATITLAVTPAPPTAIGATICSGGQGILTASGASEGDYRWYTVPVGGSPIDDPDGDDGEDLTASTYTTPVLSVTTTFYVVIRNGACESSRTPVTATVTPFVATPTELAALTAFYNATNGDFWNDNTNWITDPDVSTWVGIKIGAGCKVTGIELPTNNLTGYIPSEIGDLTDLEALILPENDLSDYLPFELSSLTNLKELWLAENNMVGTIPTDIGLLTNLEVLNLSGNNFEGIIPAEIGDLTSLNYLDLSFNYLTGEVPATFNNLINLTGLYLSNNLLTDLPDLSGLAVLETVTVEHNALTFEDLEPNISLPYFSYDPQAMLPPGGIISFQDAGILTIPFTTPGVNNEYQWFQDGSLIPGANSATYTKTNADINDVGVYTLLITNTLVTGITLEVEAYKVVVEPCASASRLAGSNDASFEPNIDNPTTVLGVGIQSTGKIILSMFPNTIEGTLVDGFIRLNEDGTLDNTFTSNAYYSSVLIQNDDKIIAYYHGTSSQLIRFNEDGTEDNVFNANAPELYTGTFYGIDIQPDQKIVYSYEAYGGYHGFERLNQDGTLDASFSPPSDFLADIIKVQSDGKILTVHNSTLFFRFNDDGSSDGSFISGYSNGPITDVAIQPDNKIIIVGNFSQFNSELHYGIVRLNDDGSIDASFVASGVSGLTLPGVGPDKVALLSNNKIVVAGVFDTFNGAARKNIILLNTDGSVDCFFDAESSTNNTVISDLKIQGDDKVLLAGDFTWYDNAVRIGLTRINMGPLIEITLELGDSDAGACEGSLFTFYTEATGASNLTYQWEVSIGGDPFVDVVNGGGYSNATTSNLTINTAGFFGEGRYRCRVSGDFAADAYTKDQGLVITTGVAAPSTVSATFCGSGSVVLSAAGAVNGEYRWYTDPVLNTPVVGELNDTYTTPVLSITTSYYVSRNNGACESARTVVTATAVTSPSAPVTSGDSICDSGLAILTATGGSNGQYRWYALSSGGSPLIGETNETFTTPIITATTTYYVSIDNGTCEGTRTSVEATVVNTPSVPTVIPASVCGPSVVNLSASGTSPGQYRWYENASGGTALAGETNPDFNTPTLTNSTTYYVSAIDGICESARIPVVATINPIPTQPTINASTPISFCEGGSVVLTASTANDYLWSTGETTPSITVASSATITVVVTNVENCSSVASAETIVIENALPAQPLISVSGSTVICEGSSITLSAPSANAYTWSTGETTQSIEVSTAGSFTVAITDVNGCVSVLSDPMVTTLQNCVSNQPPSIETTPLATQVGGLVSLNLLTLLDDPDGNLDLSTLQIVTQPQSGAIASIDENGNLQIDYEGVPFTGIDRLVIQVCDLAGSCTEQELTIEVIGEVEVYNAISPNGDNLNDVFIIQYIDVIPETAQNKVTIFNRWGDEVFSVSNYNNDTRVFKGLSNSGKELTSGTYFYKIEYTSGRPPKTGYLSLKR